ncbi:porin family protein [Fibrella sp. WM1]|uniref:porin family protein n=1 Tax=Fibrella musci TaxID=3242485 RepID=UPI003522BB2E
MASFLSFLLGGVVLLGSNALGQPRFGIRFGMQQSRVTYPIIENNTSFNSIYRFQGGVLADVPIGQLVSIQPTLMASFKGVYFKGEVVNGNTGVVIGSNESKFRPLYLELSAPVVYRFEFAKNRQVFVGAGPYGAVGIMGDIQRYVLYQSYDIDIKWVNNGANQGGANQYNRFDYGYTLIAGLELNHYLITANFTEGLIKPTNFFSAQTQRNQTTGLTVGFILGAKRTPQTLYYEK